MSSGKPDWLKLNMIGKLPESQRNRIPMLEELDVAKKRIKELEAEIAALKGDGNNEVKKGRGRPAKVKDNEVK